MKSVIIIFLVIIAKIHGNEARSTTKPYRARVDNLENKRNVEVLAKIIEDINVLEKEIKQNEKSKNDAAKLRTKPYKAKVDNNKNKRNRDQLAKVIEYLNANTETEIEQNDKYENIADTGNFKLADILKLAQSNYDARVAYNELKDAPARIHIIENPEVIMGYMKALRTRAFSNSDSSDTDDSDFERKVDYPAGQTVMLRRQAKSQNKAGSQKNNDGKESYVKADIEFELSRPKVAAPKFSIRRKDANQKYDDDSPSKYIQPSSRNQKKSDDPWDIKTQNNKDDGNEVRREKNISMRQKFYSESKTKDNLNFEPQKRGKERKKQIERSNKDISWEKEDNSWKTTKKETEQWTVKKKKDYDYDEPKPKKKKVTYDWDDQPKRNKRIDEDRNKKNTYKWDDEPKRYKKDDDGWKKVTRSSRSSWDEITTTPRDSWQKKKKTWDSYSKPKYAPRIPERQNIGRHGSAGGFHGRTPIPFVGRVGIYEEK